MTLDSAFLKVLIPQGDPFLVGDTSSIPLNYNLWLPSVCFEFVPKDQQEKREIIILAEVLTLIIQRREMLLCNGGKEEYV